MFLNSMKVLVTGGSRGIGKSIFEELSKDYEVHISGRVEATLKSLNPAGYCVCDLSKDINPILDYIKKVGFEIIVNNAGEYVYSKIDDVTEDMCEKMFHTNLISPVRIISSSVPYMKQKKFGRIINIGSISGVMGEAGASIYSSTKSGLIGLTKALALELAEYNITVNTINPGWVDTELGNESVNESEFTKEEVVDCIPQKRFISPIEIAGLVKYLISEDAKGITGQSVNMCAGLTVGC